MAFESQLIVMPGHALMWQLDAPLIYVTQRGERINVPQGFQTDLATIPALLAPILPINDNHRPAAVIHDWLYSNRFCTRARADRILFEAMADCGERSWRRHVIYIGVRIGGWTHWRKTHNSYNGK